MLLRAVICCFSVTQLFGCSDLPSAAPLTNDAVYRNEQLGFRMLAPEGWALTSRTVPPPGELPKPILLVSYIQARGEKPAEFELVLADVPEEQDAAEFLISRKLGPIKWKPTIAKEPTKIGGEDAVRYRLESSDASSFRREMRVLRRHGKVLYFVITCSVRDLEHHDQAVRCIESVVWTK